MSAPQDAWAGPLAKSLIDAWRSTDLTFVRVEPGVYDEATGTIVVTETAIPSAGAVVRSSQVERDGTQQEHELIAWIDHATVPWPVTTKDRLRYLGRTWKIVGIDPTYGSGTAQDSGAIYLETQGHSIITSLDGAMFIVQGSENTIASFNMYASKITARAE